jgi:hypothetical protein
MWSSSTSRLAGVTAMAVVATFAAVPALPAAPAAATPRTCAADLPDEASALAEARSCGGEVGIAGQVNEYDQGWAQSNGQVRWEHHYRPVRIKRANAWTPVDTTLVLQPDGTVKPGATAVDLTFSGGGTASMVTITEDGDTMRFGSPLGSLPKPILAGGVATYPEVLPGVDMQLQADVDGYAEVLVVKSRAAGANPKLAKLEFPLSADGLSVTADGGGNLRAVDVNGRVKLVGNAPQMWDASAQAATKTRLPMERGSFGRLKKMAMLVSPSQVSVTPDQSMLDDPDTAYPVYIDPGVTATRSAWTKVNSVNPTTSYWNSAGTAQVGGTNISNNKYRSFFDLDVASTPIAGKYINDADFHITQQYALYCESHPVELWSTGYAGSAATWNTQPAWATSYGSVTSLAGCSGHAAADVAFDVTSHVQSAASGAWSNLTYALRAPAADETGLRSYKEFNNNPYVTISYTAYPTVTSKGTAPATVCATGSSRPYVNTANPTLSVRVTDPEGATVRPEIEWDTLAGVKIGSAQPLPGGASGSLFSAAVPAGAFVNGTSYSWKARGFDSTVWGPWSTSCEFTVDTTATVALPQLASRGMVDDTTAVPVAAPCVTGSSRPVVKTLTPQMWATFTHATDSTVNADFEYGTLDGATLGTEHVDAQPIAGHVQAWVPQDMLNSSSTYRWRVRSRNPDGSTLGTFSSWCEFTVQATFSRVVYSTDYDQYTAASDAIPVSTDDLPDEVGSAQDIPPLNGVPPYVPTPDTGEVATEDDPDEDAVAPDAYSVQAVPAAVDEGPPADAALQTGQPAITETQPCPFDVSAIPQDGSAVPAPAGVSNGSYTCSPATLSVQDADTQDAFAGSEVNAEVGPDTPETFAAAVNGGTYTASSSSASAIGAAAVGDKKNTPLPDVCRLAPLHRWFIDRYNACYAATGAVNAYSAINGDVTYDGTVLYTYWRLARQSPIRGAWDYHVYLRVDAVSSSRVKGLRVSVIDAWCSHSRCSSDVDHSSASVDTVGQKAQFTVKYTARLANVANKRIQDTGLLSLVFERPGDTVMGVVVIESNWVRCDQALKGSASVGCVVPNFIPSLYYSRHGRYPDLANHIWHAQQSGLAGVPGSIFEGQAGSSQALRRLYDPALKTKNGRRACPSGYRVKVGAPKSTSCDEYPFRSTYQGAYTSNPTHNLPRSFPDFCHIPDVTTKFGPLGYSRCFINAKQNSDGGNWVGRLYGVGSGGKRILDGDRFYVSIG